MSRLLVLVLIFGSAHVYAIKGENKTVQDVFDHFNPIVSELALEAQNLSRYYRHETSTQIKQSLEVYPQDLQQKSADRGKILQSEIKQFKSETKSVNNYDEIYQKCRPQINKELDALNVQNEEQSKQCQKYLKQIEMFLNNTELPDELQNLVAETDNITAQCEKYEKTGQVRKCFNNKLNITKPRLRKLKEDVNKRIEVIQNQFPSLTRPYMECNFALSDNIVHGIREITIRNLRKCLQM